MIRNIMNDGTPEVLAFSFGDIDQYFKVTIGTTLRRLRVKPSIITMRFHTETGRKAGTRG